MNATTSFELLAITEEFLNDKNKAKAFVQKIEQTIEGTVKVNSMELASKADLAMMEAKLSKTIYLVGLVQFLAIVGSVLAIITFMLG